MKLLHKTLDATSYTKDIVPEGCVLFDIETTGLSADTSYLYLIGAVYRKEDSLVLSQWFCDEYSEEKEVLSSFLTFLEDKTTLVHFNGTGFDIPYLNKKFKRHCLRGSIDASATTDLYKLLLPFKKHTILPDFKQKTLEEACGFHREDTFSGGDLIEVYAAYAGKSRLAALTGRCEEADALRHILLLHNHDDLLGLLFLFSRTHLQKFFTGTILPSVLKLPDGVLYSFDFPLLPFALTLTQNDCTFTVSEHTTDLFLPLQEGKLKYFFKDYKNYSFLKYEDTAIHNSIAEWVDKDAKEKCKPDTAYQKKNGTFLALPYAKPEKEPCLESLPCFYPEYKTLPAYIEFSEKTVCDKSFTTACFEVFLKSK